MDGFDSVCESGQNPRSALRSDPLIARGYTNPPSRPHAEAMALIQVPGALHEVTAFVTLELCAFYGRTPSCAEALIARKIARVVVALSVRSCVASAIGRNSPQVLARCEWRRVQSQIRAMWMRVRQTLRLIAHFRRGHGL